MTSVTLTSSMMVVHCSKHSLSVHTSVHTSPDEDGTGGDDGCTDELDDWVDEDEDCTDELDGWVGGLESCTGGEEG